MSGETKVQSAYARFLDLAREVAAAGQYEVAYHGLMAAVHSAEEAGDTARLGEVAGVLRHYRDVIDAIRPAHKLSTQSAHGGRSIFEMGAVMAETAVKRLDAQHRVAEIHLKTTRR